MSRPEDMSREQLIGEVCKLRHKVKEITNKEVTINVLCDWIGGKSGISISEYADLMVEAGVMSIGEGMTYLQNHGFTDREIGEILHLDD